MIGAVSTALAGMREASGRIERSAERLASPAATGEPLAAIVDVVAAQADFDINTAVLRSALSLEKRVLDILV